MFILNFVINIKINICSYHTYKTYLTSINHLSIKEIGIKIELNGQ